MYLSFKVKKILETLLGKVKDISKQNNIWADMSLYCQDEWVIDFQSFDPFSAMEFFSFHNIKTGEYSFVLNTGNLRTYNMFTDNSLNERVFPVLRNIITSISKDTKEDYTILRSYILELTTNHVSEYYKYDLNKIENIAAFKTDSITDIIKIHYY